MDRCATRLHHQDRTRPGPAGGDRDDRLTPAGPGRRPSRFDNGAVPICLFEQGLDLNGPPYRAARSPQEKPMHAASGRNDRVRVGGVFPTLELAATSGQQVTVPDPAGGYVHLQLRRFAGCPICNRHLRSIVTRHDEIRPHGNREVVVFHSTAAELTKFEAELPFPLIADPERELYRRLGVERGLSSLLSTRALRAAIAGPTAAPGDRSTKRRAPDP